MTKELVDLARMTDAVYRNRLAGLQRLSAEEAKVRQTLASLDAARQIGRSALTVDMEMRAIGADLLWQGWVTRQRMEQNILLANLLIQKEAMRKQLQASFGRAQVAESLLASHMASDRNKRNKQN